MIGCSPAAGRGLFASPQDWGLGGEVSSRPQAGVLGWRELVVMGVGGMEVGAMGVVGDWCRRRGYTKEFIYDRLSDTGGKLVLSPGFFSTSTKYYVISADMLNSFETYEEFEALLTALELLNNV